MATEKPQFCPTPALDTTITVDFRRTKIAGDEDKQDKKEDDDEQSSLTDDLEEDENLKDNKKKDSGDKKYFKYDPTSYSVVADSNIDLVDHWLSCREQEIPHIK